MHILQKRILEVSKSSNVHSLKLRELGSLIGESHPQKIKHHLSQLITKGLINNDINKPIKRMSGDDNLISIPILGSANCGVAEVEAVENFEGMLRISKTLLHQKRIENLIAIKPVGNSMNAANINGLSIEEGDYVIIDCNNRNPADGDYILSIIDGLANIKRFRFDKKNKNIILTSESTSNYPPIFIHPEDVNSYLVNGKVIQVIKKPNFVD